MSASRAECREYVLFSTPTLCKKCERFEQDSMTLRSHLLAALTLFVRKQLTIPF